MTLAIEKTKVLAGIVLYQPPPESQKLVEELISQGCDICSVVNGHRSVKDLAFYEERSIWIEVNSENVGLAGALNAIITYFLGSKYTHLFLFDQDSMPASDFIDTMLEEHHALAAHASSIACIAPCVRDSRLGHLGKHHVRAATSKPSALSAITSGCLFTKDSLRMAGPMDDALFIDGIDHEWCYRAQSMGLRISLCQNAILHHELGDWSIALGRVRKTMHSNPLRHYYIIRNSLYLARKPYIPWRWRALELLKTSRRAVAYPLFSPAPAQSLQMVILGLIHGLTGRMGKLNRTPK
ncbi:rhamnosyltransferase [Cyanobium sp. PCC 7001]|uniref:glycosyltransferase n=1 Tax=Cyanobium sp. PCC 7001 TaxID=180281 RepID=UPI0001805083|nr:glycosyltransferase [Cyanobium sp. PCC 7001]EDY37695.1 rhamnosyltransferase [Cyanobium sp. PCC 7001]